MPPSHMISQSHSQRRPCSLVKRPQRTTSTRGRSARDDNLLLSRDSRRFASPAAMPSTSSVRFLHPLDFLPAAAAAVERKLDRFRPSLSCHSHQSVCSQAGVQRSPRTARFTQPRRSMISELRITLDYSTTDGEIT